MKLTRLQTINITTTFLIMLLLSACGTSSIDTSTDNNTSEFESSFFVEDFQVFSNENQGAEFEVKGDFETENALKISAFGKGIGLGGNLAAKSRSVDGIGLGGNLTAEIKTVDGIGLGGNLAAKSRSADGIGLGGNLAAEIKSVDGIGLGGNSFAEASKRGIGLGGNFVSEIKSFDGIGLGGNSFSEASRRGIGLGGNSAMLVFNIVSKGPATFLISSGESVFSIDAITGTNQIKMLVNDFSEVSIEKM